MNDSIPAEFSPSELLYRLWCRKHWAVMMVAGCLVLSWLYLQKAERLFEIQANLLLQPNAHGLNVGEKQNERPNTELIATQSEILSSRKMLTRTAEAFLASNGASAHDNLVEYLIAELNVKRVVGTRILNVSLRCQDPEDGQQLVAQLFDQYQTFLFELNQGGQVEALSTLTTTEQELRTQLAELQDRFRELRSTSPLVGDTVVDLALQQTLLERLGIAYSEIRTRRIGLENRLAAVDEETADVNVARTTPPDQKAKQVLVSRSGQSEQTRVGTGDSDSESERGWGALQMLSQVDTTGLQDPVDIQKELFQAEVSRQELIKKFGEKHHEIQAVESQIADWKRRLQSLINRAPRTLAREVQATKLQEDRLHAVYQTELAAAKSLDQHSLKQTHMRNQIDQLQTLHTSTVTQLAGLRLNNKVTTDGGADLRITVLDPPVSSSKPIWPNEKLVLGGGALMGLLGSSLLVLVPVRRREDKVTIESISSAEDSCRK